MTRTAKRSPESMIFPKDCNNYYRTDWGDWESHQQSLYRRCCSFPSANSTQMAIGSSVREAMLMKRRSWEHIRFQRLASRPALSTRTFRAPLHSDRWTLKDKRYGHATLTSSMTISTHRSLVRRSLRRSDEMNMRTIYSQMVGRPWDCGKELWAVT
jgi:hypothetical protein